MAKPIVMGFGSPSEFNARFNLESRDVESKYASRQIFLFDADS